jgi:hypothetical protein
MKTEFSLPHLHELANATHSKSEGYSISSRPIFWQSSLILFFQLRVGLLGVPLPSHFPAKILYAFVISRECHILRSTQIILSEYAAIIIIIFTYYYYYYY